MRDSRNTSVGEAALDRVVTDASPARTDTPPTISAMFASVPSSAMGRERGTDTSTCEAPSTPSVHGGRAASRRDGAKPLDTLPEVERVSLIADCFEFVDELVAIGDGVLRHGWETDLIDDPINLIFGKLRED
jgi:hypothetical protein